MSSGINVRQLICRACLKMQKDMFNIFNPCKSDKLISDILMDCTPIKIQKDDGLPMNICNACLETLNSVCDFITMVVESNSRLLQYYSNKSNQELLGSDPSCPFTIKEESLGICKKDLLPSDTNGKIEEDGITIFDITSAIAVSANNKSNQQVNEDEDDVSMEVSSKSEIKNETDDCNMGMPDVDDGNSLSLDSFINSLSDNDSTQQSKKKKRQSKIIYTDLSTLQMSSPKTERTKRSLAEDEENDTPLKSLDISEYEHLKTTLSRQEKRKARLFCKLCKKSYKFNYYFSIHLRTHIGDIPHKCNICGKGFPQGAPLRQHMKIHTESKPYTCEVCGKSFKTTTSLSIHMMVHTKESPLTCLICNNKFKHEFSLRVHLRRHNGEQQCICELCGRSFYDRTNLYNHMQTHKTEQSYTCTECNKSFKSKRSLKDHAKRHSDERPFVCSVCNKGFKDKGVLDEHVAIHTGARPYACKICGKTFRQYSCIPRHMRIHTGETPFPCQKCPSAFKYSHHLKNHMKTHKPDNADVLL